MSINTTKSYRAFIINSVAVTVSSSPNAAGVIIIVVVTVVIRRNLERLLCEELDIFISIDAERISLVIRILLDHGLRINVAVVESFPPPLQLVWAPHDEASVDHRALHTP